MNSYERFRTYINDEMLIQKNGLYDTTVFFTY